MTATQPRDSTVRPQPPIAEKKRHETTVHGESLVDDYFWLRERDSAEVRAHLEAENAYTEAMTAHTEDLQKELYDEIVGRIKETDLSVPVRRGDFYYYSRTEKGKQYPIICCKAGSLEAAEEVLLDVNQLAEGSEFFRVGAFEVSPDHELLAYATDDSGAEKFTLRIKRLADGALLPDVVEGVYYSLEWGNDDKTLFYTTLDDARRPYRVHRHVLGQAAAEDEILYEEKDEAFTVGLGKTRSQRYVVLSIGSSTTTEMRLLDADRPAGSFELFQPRVHEVEYDVEHWLGDASTPAGFFVRTNEGAKNFRLYWAPEGAAREAWTEVIEPRDHVKLEGVDAYRDHLVIVEREAGLRRMTVRRLSDGSERPIELPESLYAIWPGNNPEYEAGHFRYTYTSMVTPRSVFDFDFAAGTSELQKQEEVLGGYDPAEYVTERIYARAGDGIAIPVSLVYRKDYQRDGEHPALLYGYGSYGASIEPSFSLSRVSLLDRGWLFAVAHVRGGGVLGEAWHDEGKMLNKRNTFTDFVAAAEHLLLNRYTARDRFAIQGGSAGGLLMGAVLNLRPDLFAAAIADVPFVDVINTMMDADIPLTVGEYEEWGNPEDEEYYRYMRTYSPYENVTAQAYPSILITAGLNDSRVQYWEPAKWAAKLRATKTDDHVLLLKTNMGAGHSGASGRYDAIKETAFDYAFLIDTIERSMAAAEGGEG